VMSHEFDAIQDSEALAITAVNVYASFLISVSSLVGVLAAVALLRRSLRYKEASSVPYSRVLADEQNGLLNAIGLWLRTQPPEEAREASIAALSRYLELLDAFIGDHLTRQLVYDTWPKLRMPPSKEKPA
jgi:hypothetical protein